MKKFALSLCVSIITVVLLCSNLFAMAYTPTFEVEANNALLVNIDTDEVVYSKNADERIYTASLSYLMNAIVVCEKADFDEVVTVKGEVVDSLLGTNAIIANLKADEQITVGDLMRCMLIASHNDAALVLADYVAAGDADKFVKMMNDKGKSLGLKNTNYNTAVGLFDEKQYTTANDLFKVYMAAMEVDAIAEILSQTRYTVPATNKSSSRLLSTTNRLIDRTTNYYYKHALVGKTGNSDKSGRCIASTAESDGKRYVCILAGCSDAEKRVDFADSISLYKWAYANFEYKTVVSKGEQVSVSANVDLSWDVDTITLTAGESVVALLPKDADLSTVEYVVTLDKEVFDAPIKKGEKMGTAKIYFSNPNNQDSEPLGEITLLAGQEVEGSAALMLWRWIKGIITNPFVVAIIVAVVVLFIVMTIVANVKAKRERKKKLKLKKRL